MFYWFDLQSLPFHCLKSSCSVLDIGVSKETHSDTIDHVDQIERRSGLKQLNSLPHLELVVNSIILLSVKVGQDDLQLVIALAGQTVDPLKAKPALS